MKKAVKIIVLVLAAGFLVIQLFQIDKSNPPINEGETMEAAVSVPPEISSILSRSCNDCHSNNTVYPWYSYIQPVGWFLKNHIDEGRDELNFSRFAAYEPKRRNKKFKEVCEQVGSGEMPMTAYVIGHPNAALTEADKKALCDWANSLRRDDGSDH